MYAYMAADPILPAGAPAATLSDVPDTMFFCCLMAALLHGCSCRFFDIVVVPLFYSFSRVFTNTKPLLAYVMRNYKVWAEQQAGPKSS